MDEILKYIDKNKENLKEKNISFNYSKVTPATLIGIDEYNDLFFQKIDNIENDISNGFTYDELLRKNNLKSVFQANFKLNDKNISEVINKDVLKKIFNKAEENKIELLEENDFYVLYEIKKVEKILPSIESTNFISNVKEIMVNKSKNDFNYDLIKKISQKSFTQKSFEDISHQAIPVPKIFQLPLLAILKNLLLIVLNTYIHYQKVALALLVTKIKIFI